MVQKSFITNPVYIHDESTFCDDGWYNKSKLNLSTMGNDASSKAQNGYLGE